MEKIGESELIINSDGSIFHLHVRPEQLADIVILVGDPGRIDMVSSFFDLIETKVSSREFITVTGQYNNKRISVVSTGIGCDNIDIVMTELDALVNIDFATRKVKKDKKKLTILRIGSSGATQADIPLGSYVYSEVSVGFDGLLNWYADRDEIAMKDYEEAFIRHTGWNKYLTIPYFVKSSGRLTNLFAGCSIPGMTISASGFYGPQCRQVRLPIVIPDLLEKIESFRFEGRRITNFEMESSAIAGLSKKLGHDGGTICLIIANRYVKEANPDYKPLMRNLIKLCLDKLTI